MLTENQVKHVEHALDVYIHQLERQATEALVRPLNLRGKVTSFPKDYQVIIDEAKETRRKFRGLVQVVEPEAVVEEVVVEQVKEESKETVSPVAQSTDKLIGVDKATAEKLYPKIEHVVDDSKEIRAERALAAKTEIVDQLDETVKAALATAQTSTEEVPVVVKKKVSKDVKE